MTDIVKWPAIKAPNKVIGVTMSRESGIYATDWVPVAWDWSVEGRPLGNQITCSSSTVLPGESVLLAETVRNSLGQTLTVNSEPFGPFDAPQGML